MADEQGGLTLPERLSRIEQTLDRIETHLESKISLGDLLPVTRRVELLEAGETPLGRVMLDQWRTVTATVNDLSLHGSREAQDALKRIEVIESDIDTLKSNDVTRRATDKTVAQTNEKYYKRLTAILSIAVILLMIGQIIIATTS